MQTLIEHQPGKPTWIPPTAQSPSKNDNKTRQKRKDVTSSPADASSAQSDDAGYNRFYNTFGSLINRISAPLAFASLPLIQEESTLSEESQSSPESSRSKPSNRVRPTHATSVEPDLTKVISKATMNAILKDGIAPSDSFYVVPTSGHTISYANILSYAEKEKRRLEASSHGSLGGGDEEDDDFVDAKETPTSLSPGAKRRVGRARTDRELSNTIEELYTENKSLKDMLDKLTKRLHAFEASAQNMAESYRMMRPGSPLSNASSSRAKVADDEYSMMRGHIEKLEKENKKMQKTLDKYREKWETLKAGAKARREAQGGGDAVDDAVPG
jgi:prefoldin subunit 5